MIELELNSLNELYNSFDPAPFHEKELDPEAEEYIYNAVDEFPLKKPTEIMIHLPPAEVSEETQVSLKMLSRIISLIRNSFLKSN